jgi:galactokinase
MTGGGFGGAIVALIEEDSVARFSEKILDAYGSAGRAYHCRASDGARVLA